MDLHMTKTSNARLTAIRFGSSVVALCLALAAGGFGAVVTAQDPHTAQAPVPKPTVAPPSAPSADSGDVAADYVIGPTDVLSIVFWGEKELSNDVTVRPDGKISLPLFNDVVAAGSTPEQLRQRLAETAKRLIKDPVVAVVVKQVNNNRVFITGQVARAGQYVMTGQTTVLQLIALAGGFTEFADRKHVLITRLENGIQKAFNFNYDDVVKKQDLRQNLILRVGDTVVVP
jgi:polysaccharide export outer membrane protein